MNGIEAITDKIIDDAKESAKAAIDAAREQADQIISEAREVAERERQALLSRAQKEAETVLSRANSSADLQHRNAMLSARSELIDDAFIRAKQTLLSDPKTYGEVLCLLLKKALRDVPADAALQLILNETDRAAFGKSLIESVHRVTLSEQTVDMDGGFMLQYGDVTLNCSLTMLLEEVKTALEGEISRILFPAEGSI